MKFSLLVPSTAEQTAAVPGGGGGHSPHGKLADNVEAPVCGFPRHSLSAAGPICAMLVEPPDGTLWITALGTAEHVHCCLVLNVTLWDGGHD